MSGVFSSKSTWRLSPSLVGNYPCKDVSKNSLKGFPKEVGSLDLFLAKTICQYFHSLEDLQAFSQVFYPRKTQQTVYSLLRLIGKIRYLQRTNGLLSRPISHRFVLRIFQTTSSNLSPEKTSCFYPIESWLKSIANEPYFINAKTLSELFQILLNQETSKENGKEKLSEKLLAIFRNTRNIRISSPWGEKSMYLQQLYDYKNMENTYTAADEQLQDLDLSNREEHNALPALLTAMNTVKTVSIGYIHRLSGFSSVRANHWLFLKARAKFWIQEIRRMQSIAKLQGSWWF